MHRLWLSHAYNFFPNFYERFISAMFWMSSKISDDQLFLELCKIALLVSPYTILSRILSIIYRFLSAMCLTLKKNILDQIFLTSNDYSSLILTKQKPSGFFFTHRQMERGMDKAMNICSFINFFKEYLLNKSVSNFLSF